MKRLLISKHKLENDKYLKAGEEDGAKNPKS